MEPLTRKVWRCPISGDCWSPSPGTLFGFPTSLRSLSGKPMEVFPILDWPGIICLYIIYIYNIYIYYFNIYIYIYTWPAWLQCFADFVLLWWSYFVFRFQSQGIWCFVSFMKTLGLKACALSDIQRVLLLFGLHACGNFCCHIFCVEIHAEPSVAFWWIITDLWDLRLAPPSFPRNHQQFESMRGHCSYCDSQASPEILVIKDYQRTQWPARGFFVRMKSLWSSLSRLRCPNNQLWYLQCCLGR